MASNPTKQPQKTIGELIAMYEGAPASWIVLAESVLDEYKKFSNPKGVFPLLSQKFLMLGAVPIPRELTRDAAYYGRGAQNRVAVAQSGPIQIGTRSTIAQRNMAVAFQKLPKEGFPPFTQEFVERKITDVVYAKGGIETCYRRILDYMRARNDRIDLDVPSPREVKEALKYCGYGDEVMAGLESLDLSFDRESHVKVNPHSSNGFPVCGTPSDPDAFQQVLRLARMISRELRTRRIEPLNSPPVSFSTVAQWYSWNIEHRPWLVLALGKVKGDYYSKEKVQKHMLRFYNVVPRQLMLVMQQATQSAEGNALNCNTSREYFVRSAKGISYTKGGADEMVNQLQRELDRRRMAWVHAGDDTLVVIGDARWGYVIFSVDASSFDLTQHADVMAPIIEEMRVMLGRINADAADLWAEFQKRRIVAMGKGLVVEMTHGGPSGSPMQSVKNDVLMEIFMARLYGRVNPMALNYELPSPEELDSYIREVGTGLDLRVRLEDRFYSRVPWDRIDEDPWMIKDALKSRPFLFLGYYLYTDELTGKVLPYIDIARSMAQRPFRGSKWLKSAREFEVAEAMRLGSQIMGCGVPWPSLREAHEAQRQHVLELLESALRTYGDTTSDLLRWAIGESVYGPEIIPSLSGLLAAFKANRDRHLWYSHESQIVAVMQSLAPLRLTSELTSWADEVEEEEAQEAAALAAQGLVKTKPIDMLKELRTVADRPRQPATLARAGMMSPLVASTKPKPRRPDLPVADRGRGRVTGRNRDYMIAGGSESSPSEYSDYTEYTDDYDFEMESHWSYGDRDDAL